jgi:hypothetical protein
MPTRFSGGCACGAIRYDCTADPLFAVNCHCRDCQRETGGAFTPVLGVSKAHFTLTQGEPRFFGVTADSGYPTRRAFCGACGSPLFGQPDSRPDLITIRAGSLDDPRIFRPTQDIFTESAQPWDHMNPDLAKAAKLS